MFNLSERITELKKMKEFVDEMTGTIEEVRQTIDDKMDEFRDDLEAVENDVDEQISWDLEDINILDAGKNKYGLIPCPFCGEVESLSIHHNDRNYYAWCETCECMGPSIYMGLEGETKEDCNESAANRWNTRKQWVKK